MLTVRHASHGKHFATPASMSRVVWLLLIFMSVLVGRACVSQNQNYLDLKQYAHLEEAQPFQGRILMAPLLRAAADSAAFRHLYDVLFARTVDSPEDLAVALVNCASLLILLPTTLRLRRAFKPAPLTTWLAPLMTLLIITFTYVVRYEQRFTMPYDLLSVLLYTLGLLAVAQGSGWLFLFVMAVGTPNRETTVFLVVVWFWLQWRERRFRSAVAYSLTAAVIWVAWRLEIGHILGSGRAPYIFPWRTNLASLMLPTHWPQLLSVFGFTALPIWMLREHLTDWKLRTIWVAALPYLVAALVVGIWRETRIFGELSALAGLTFAIQLEQRLTCRTLSVEPGPLRS